MRLSKLPPGGDGVGWRGAAGLPPGIRQFWKKYIWLLLSELQFVVKNPVGWLKISHLFPWTIFSSGI